MKKTRILYFDFLNIASCIAVLFLHHNGLVHSFSTDSIWRECLVAEVLFYWAVPIFLMLSGANLMSYRERYGTREFFRRRILKVLFPWLFWSGVLLVWKTSTGAYVLQSNSPQEIVNVIINTKIQPVYWFFPTIISIYLIIPFLSIYTGEKYRRLLWYIVGCALFFNATIPFFGGLVGIWWNSSINIPLSGYVIFVLIGYLLSTMEIERKNRICIYAMGIICLLSRYVGAYKYSMRDGEKNLLFFNYTYIYAYGIAIAVFVLFKYINWRQYVNIISSCFKCNMEHIISSLSGCSLGIYLIHKEIMPYELKLLNIDTSNLLWRTIGPILTYVVCFIIVYTIKKIPYINKIFP